MATKLDRHPFEPWSLALYGMTHTGKSSQCAKLARYIFNHGGLKTRWYLFDDGDTPAETDAGVRDGFIEVVDCRGVPHPFLGALRMTYGKVPLLTGKIDEAKDIAEGKWVDGDLSEIGLIVFDSGTALCDDMFQDLSAKTALGLNIGGEGGMTFKDGSEGWGAITIGGSNRGHYQQVQTRIQDMISRLKQLAARAGVMVVMTFAEDRGDTEATKMSFIGPKTKGSAQTTVLPGWFKFCFRMVTIPTAANKEPKHVLWTERHRDGGVDALANRRFPVLDVNSPLLLKYPPMLDPADVVQALLNYQAVVQACGGKVGGK